MSYAKYCFSRYDPHELTILTMDPTRYQASLWSPCLTALLKAISSDEKEKKVMLSYSFGTTVVKILSLGPTVNYILSHKGLLSHVRNPVICRPDTDLVASSFGSQMITSLNVPVSCIDYRHSRGLRLTFLGGWLHRVSGWISMFLPRGPRQSAFLNLIFTIKS